MNQGNEEIYLKKINSCWSRVEGDPGVIRELSEDFTFDVPGARFMPSFKQKYWDGKIRLIKRSNKVYSGLLNSIKEWCEEKGYTFGTDLDFQDKIIRIPFSKWYSAGKDIFPKDHQLKAIYNSLKWKRGIFLSPTASGKSLIIYTIARTLLEKTKGKILVLVPTTSLVEQLYSDFIDYSNGEWDVENYCTRIYSGMKREDKRIVFSTWQSLYNLPSKAFDIFDAVIGDECHLYKSKEISGLLEKISNAEYRYGFTGTLDGIQTNKLILEGLFGKVFKVATTSELITEGHLSNFEINCIVLEHTKTDREKTKDGNFEEEITFIIENKLRNKFIAELAAGTNGNTLVLSNRVETHGKVLFEQIKTITNKKVYFISGEIDTSYREEVRREVEKSNNSIIVATSQVFSTGINIPSLSNIIFTYPSKSRVRVLQSIGRVLRLSPKKTKSIIYDISDNLTWKEKANYTYNHFVERLKIYTSENFKYKIFKIDMEKIDESNIIL